MADANSGTDPTGEGSASCVSPLVAYARGVHKESLDFNRELYSRAQIVLTLDGVLVTAAGAVLASNADSLSKIGANWLTALLVAVAAIALLVAVFSATLGVLRSRHRSASAMPHGSESSGKPRLEDLWFYGRIAKIEENDPGAFLRSVSQCARDPGFEAKVRLEQVRIMAPHLVKRDNWLNRAWILTAVALSFLAAAVVQFLILSIN